MSRPSDEEKRHVWECYHTGAPVRVPLRWNVNSRIVVLDPALNPEGYEYEAVFHDPQVALITHTRFQEYVATTLSQTCDTVSRLPEIWHVRVDDQNTAAAYFGAELTFRKGEVPSVEPVFSFDDADDFLATDFSEPLENPWLKDRIAFQAALKKEAVGFTYLDRKVEVQPFIPGPEGVLTTAVSLFGEDFLLLMATDPEKSDQVLTHILDATIRRDQAVAGYYYGDWAPPTSCWYADDSIQLIGSDMYKKRILPLHRRWYDEMSTAKAQDNARSIHLCGDATRHFPFIHEELGVVSFDTGFPVDHGQLREDLGPDVEISGGPAVNIISNGTPKECFNAAKTILQSGVMEGGRFILQEGNNLPPCCSFDNLHAIYDACLEFGWYERRE